MRKLLPSSKPTSRTRDRWWTVIDVGWRDSVRVLMRRCSKPQQCSQAMRPRDRRGQGRDACALHQDAFDAAFVGARDVLWQPVLAEDAVGHLDDDVVGLEQAVDEVALVALQALQAARARRQDLEVALPCAAVRRAVAPAHHRAQRGLVLSELLFLAEA